MTSDNHDLIVRLSDLERTIRRTRLVASTAAIGLLATWVTGAAWRATPQDPDQVATKLLIIRDNQGRDRVVLGAPMPDGRDYVGMKILNGDGAEQFGLGLKLDGSVSMGFDTRPGVGHPGNRERLNMGVNASGQGWIRYLDNQTRARVFLRLDAEDAPVLQFLDWPDGQPIQVRQIEFSGERLLEWER